MTWTTYLPLEPEWSLVPAYDATTGVGAGAVTSNRAVADPPPSEAWAILTPAGPISAKVTPPLGAAPSALTTAVALIWRPSES